MTRARAWIMTVDRKMYMDERFMVRYDEQETCRKCSFLFSLAESLQSFHIASDKVRYIG